MSGRVILLSCALVVLVRPVLGATYSWNWDSGATEGWKSFGETTVVTIENGFSGTFGLGMQDISEFDRITTIEIKDQAIDPSQFVGGQVGRDLPMTGLIYVDINRSIDDGNGGKVDMWVHGNESRARFLSSPIDGYGYVVELGNGWYRHFFSNWIHGRYDAFPDPVSSESFGRITFAWDRKNELSPVVIDNLTFIPEPASVCLLLSGVALLRKRYRG